MAISIDADGSYAWYYNGQLHNPNGEPAFYSVGEQKMWMVFVKLHRENDPAIIETNNVEYYYEEKQYEEPEYCHLILQKDIKINKKKNQN